jgi:hypothetical protein
MPKPFAKHHVWQQHETVTMELEFAGGASRFTLNSASPWPWPWHPHRLVVSREAG